MIISHVFQADQAIQKYDIVTIGRFDGTVMKVVWPDLEAMSNIIGIALNDAGDGSDVEICLFGVISDSSFSFNAKKPIYVSEAGRMTQVLPAKSIFKIGKAISKNQVLINLSELLLLYQP